MAIVYVEGYDWAGSGIPNGQADVASRYSVIDLGGSVLVGGGRFGGNSYTMGATANVSFQLHGGPYGPRIVVGTAFNTSNNLSNFPLIEMWDGLFNHGGTPQISLAINAAGKLELRAGNNGATLAVGTLVLQPNTWYYVEWDVLIAGAGAGTSVCQVDGVQQFNVAGVTTQQSGAAQLTHIMWLGAGNPALFDDQYLKTTGGFLGPSRIIMKRPNANGATIQWTPNPGPNNFAMVNESPPDLDTTFNSNATATNIDLYAMTALGQNPLNIWAVQVDLYARKDDAGARAIAAEVRSGGTNFVGVTQPALTTTYLALYTQIFEQDPKTAAAWTLSNLDAAQFGVQTIS